MIKLIAETGILNWAAFVLICLGAAGMQVLASKFRAIAKRRI